MRRVKLRQGGSHRGQGAAAVTGRREWARRDPYAGPGHRDPLRGASHRDHAVDAVGARVDAAEGRVELIADPHAVAGRGDRARPVPDGDGSHPAGRRVDLGHGEVQRVGHPHRCRGDRDAGGPGTNRNRAAGLAGDRIDPGHRAVLAVGDPDGVPADRDTVREPSNLDIRHGHDTVDRDRSGPRCRRPGWPPTRRWARWRWRQGHCPPGSSAPRCWSWC